MRHIWKQLTTRLAKEEYFRFKEKHGYSLSTAERLVHREEAVSWLQATLADVLRSEATMVLTPESTNGHFRAILEKLQQRSSLEVVYLKKRKVSEIRGAVVVQPMMKAERLKLQGALLGSLSPGLTTGM